MSGDLKQRAVRGGLAKVFAQGTQFLLRMASLMIFARLLEPEDFGLVGMVTAVTGVLGLFKDFGLSSVTVQRVTITDEETSTLFWLNLLIGGILAFLSLAIAPVLVTFYHEPRLLWVTVALSTGFLFNGAGVQHSAVLQRHMRFTALAVIEILSLMVSTAVGIGMAIGGLGYWALVGWSAILPAANSAGAWLVARWVPGSPHRQVGIRSMLRFGGTITLNILVVYIAYNLDKVLLGRFWGADALGIYGRAYQLINLPTSSLTEAVGGVAFSALARVQEDRKLIKSYFLKGYSIVLTLTVPITIFCAIFAEEIVSVLLGPGWEGVVDIFRLLSPTVLVFALINPFGWLLYSIGMVGRSLKIALVIAPLAITGYALGLPYGSKGVALGFSVSMMLWVVPHIAWCIKGTTISARDILETVRWPFLSGIAAGIVTWGMQSFLGQSLSAFLVMALGGCVLFGSYLGILACVLKQKAFYLDLISSLRKRSSGDSGNSSSTESREKNKIPASAV